MRVKKKEKIKERRKSTDSMPVADKGGKHPSSPDTAVRSAKLMTNPHRDVDIIIS